MIHVQIWEAAGNATVTDMTNAGKRGKTCEQIDFRGFIYGAPNCDIMHEVNQITRDTLRWLRELHPETPFAVVSEELTKRAKAAHAIHIAEWNLNVYPRTIRGVDAPRTKLIAGNDKFNAYADQDGIHLYDLTDKMNLPASITPSNQAASKAYVIAAKVWDKVKSATNFHEAQNVLRDAGAKLHFYCQMD